MHKAFTLIELLVVVLIIGILSAIALPQYTKAVEKSRATEAVMMLRNMEKAIDRHILENGYADASFLGTEATSSLDVDFPESTQYFTYSAACFDGSCNAYVYRKTNSIYVWAWKYPSSAWGEACSYRNSSDKSAADAFCSVFGEEPWYDK